MYSACICLAIGCIRTVILMYWHVQSPHRKRTVPSAPHSSPPRPRWRAVLSSGSVFRRRRVASARGEHATYQPHSADVCTIISAGVGHSNTSFNKKAPSPAFSTCHPAKVPMLCRQVCPPNTTAADFPASRQVDFLCVCESGFSLTEISSHN